MSASAIVIAYIRLHHKKVYSKLRLQSMHAPRKTTGENRTNREGRWTLARRHKEYASRREFTKVLAKLCAQLLCFDEAPEAPPEVLRAASDVLGFPAQRGIYHCPILGHLLNFSQLCEEVNHPKAGFSSFQVGHITPKAIGGRHTADNVYWISRDGNTMQGKNTLDEVIEMIRKASAFFSRKTAYATP